MDDLTPKYIKGKLKKGFDFSFLIVDAKSRPLYLLVESDKEMYEWWEELEKAGARVPQVPKIQITAPEEKEIVVRETDEKSIQHKKLVDRSKLSFFVLTGQVSQKNDVLKNMKSVEDALVNSSTFEIIRDYAKLQNCEDKILFWENVQVSFALMLINF